MEPILSGNCYIASMHCC